MSKPLLEKTLQCVFFKDTTVPLGSDLIIRKPEGLEISLKHLEENLSVLDLDSETPILSNLDLVALFELNERVSKNTMSTDLQSIIRRLVARTFFHLTPQDLLANHGVGVAHSNNLSEITQAQRALISSHFNLVHALLQEHYGFKYDPSVTLDQRFCASQLILKSRFSNRSFDWPKKHLEQLDEMYEKRSICGSTKIRKTGKTYRFQAQRNMVEHLALVSNRMIPFGVKLEELEPAELGQTDSEVLRVLSQENKPFCALVEVVNCEPDLGVLSSLYDRQAQELWVSDVDLVWLSEVATLSFKKILLSRSYVSPPSDLKPPAKLFGDPLIRFSPAANTTALIHLTALIGTVNDFSDSKTGLLSTWLKAVDKAQMLLYARKAKLMGFEVVSFGCAEIDCLVHESQIEQFKTFLVQHCFQYPCLRAMDENLETYLLRQYEPLIVGDELIF